MQWIKTPAVMGQLFSDAWWRRSDGHYYLTFDDGPHPETTPFILETLAAFRAEATFFCTGRAAEAYPELLECIRGAGHTVGNHSYSHPHGWKTPLKEYLDDVARADAVLKSRLFRPPYGKLTWGQYQALKADFQIVMWSVMPHDYLEALPSATVLDRLKRHTGPGEIAVLHENDRSAAHITSILPDFLDYLAEAGIATKKLPHAD